MSRPRRRIAVYPGSFDPITNGHLDIINRAREHFDGLIIAVLENTRKDSFFTSEERMRMIAESVRAVPGIEVRTFSGLLVDFLRDVKASIVIRGMRFVSDFEYELQMALMNNSLMPSIETFFMVAKPERTFVSSSLVKEIAARGRDVSLYAPPPVVAALKRKFARKKSPKKGRKR